MSDQAFKPITVRERLRGIVIDTGLSIEIRTDAHGQNTYTWVDEQGSVRFYPGEVRHMLEALRRIETDQQLREQDA